jgi:NADPH2:quinone reductase
MHFKGLKLDLVFMPIQIIHNVNRQHHGDILRRISALVDRGLIRPLIDQSYPFTREGAGAAHDRLESSKAIGKIVIAR